jgi:hypothetical protein
LRERKYRGEPKIEGRAVSGPTPFHRSTLRPNPRHYSRKNRVFRTVSTLQSAPEYASPASIAGHPTCPKNPSRIANSQSGNSRSSDTALERSLAFGYLIPVAMVHSTSPIPFPASDPETGWLAGPIVATGNR